MPTTCMLLLLVCLLLVCYYFYAYYLYATDFVKYTIIIILFCIDIMLE